MEAKDIFEKLQKQFGEEVVFDFHADPKKDKDPWCQVKPDRVVEVCRALRDDPDLRFDWLECLTGVDYPTPKLIHVVYHLWSYQKRHRMVLKAFLPREAPVVGSVEGVWKTANWHERETFDLLGVKFDGHPDLRRLLMPDDWEGHPLRKDYVEAEHYHGIPTFRPNPVDLFKIAVPEKPAAKPSPAAAPAPAGDKPAAKAAEPVATATAPAAEKPAAEKPAAPAPEKGAS